MNDFDEDNVNIENVDGVDIYLNEFVKNISTKVLNDIQDAFKQESKYNKLNEKQLHGVLKSYNVNLSDENFKPLFARIDVKKEGKVDFLQFITYVCTECDAKDCRQDERPKSSGNAAPPHHAAVVKTLYSPLYRLLVSVSAADSAIAVWDLRTGAHVAKLSTAHSKDVYYEKVPVEITAAALDPTGGLLVTGAVNGTVHVWDPYSLECLNRLRTPSRGRVSDILWLPDKMLVMGWDRRVTEFNDPLLESNGKVWLREHDDAVLSSCAKLPSLLVTTCRAGKISFWRLETGQLRQRKQARTRSESASHMASPASSANPGSANLVASGRSEGPDAAETRVARAEEAGRSVTVATHFLRNRPEAQNVGTLLVATADGVVRLWCTDREPKCVTEFQAAHVNGDFVTSMASDAQGEHLFTALRSGYVKTWHVADWGRPRGDSVPTPVHSIRPRFPFLYKSMVTGRAEYVATMLNPAGPLLVNSYRAHVQRINHVTYVDDMQLVVTSCEDKTIRLWTLAGHYYKDLGTQWPTISKKRPVIVTDFKIPSDIEREASFTTIKVLKDGANSELRTSELWEKLKVLRQHREISGNEIKRKLQGNKTSLTFEESIHNEHRDEQQQQTNNNKRVPLFTLADIKSNAPRENGKMVTFNFDDIKNEEQPSKSRRVQNSAHKTNENRRRI